MARRFLAPSTATRSGRLFYLVVMLPALLCAGLELDRIHAGVVTGYGADFFGTAWAYVIIRFRRTDRFPWRWAASQVYVAAAVFAVGTASEYAQRLHLISGTYDPFDILTFAVALVACVVLEHSLGPFASSERSPARAEITS
jgi:uncharacterized membrane protein